MRAAIAVPALALAALAIVTLALAVAVPTVSAAPPAPTEVSMAEDATVPDWPPVPDRPLAPAAHGTHIEVDPQVTTDGTVMVERLSILRDGYVVLRADDDGSPGAPVGHTAVRGVGDQSAVPVQVDTDVWTEWSGNRTLWAVLHRDDGDGEFDVDSDPALSERDPVARSAFTLRNGTEGDTRVLSTDIDAQRLDGATVTVRRVALAAPGRVVVESIDGTEILGSTRLGAGSHENVTVGLNRSFVAAQSPRFRVRAVASRDADDDNREPTSTTAAATGTPVRAGEEAVGTSILVSVADDFDASATATPAGVTASPSTGDRSESEESADGQSADGGSATAPASESPETSGSTSGAGSGFGATVTLAAAVLATAVTLAALARRGE